MALLSVRQYAKQRGVSHTAVNKAIKAGKIPTTAGKIDPAKADASWERNRDSRQPSKLAGEATRTPHVPAMPAPKRGEGPAPGTLAYAQLVRETAKAKRAAIETQRLEGKLVDADGIKRSVGGLVVAAKTRLLAIGAKVGPELAMQTDPAKCQAIVDAEVYEALAELGQWEPA